jgi:hypothetical protein
MMMAAPPSLQKSDISTDTAFSPLLLRDELPRSKIEVFHSLWSRPISYSMNLEYLIADGGNVSVYHVNEATRSVFLKLEGAAAWGSFSR